MCNPSPILITNLQKILRVSDCIYYAILIYQNVHNPYTMCNWMQEDVEEKEVVSAKAKAKDIEEFEKKEERPLTAIRQR